MPPKINKEECIGCGACIESCPHNVLELVGEKAEVVRIKDCKDVWACVDACPVNAITKP